MANTAQKMATVAGQCLDKCQLFYFMCTGFCQNCSLSNFTVFVISAVKLGMDLRYASDVSMYNASQDITGSFMQMNSDFQLLFLVSIFQKSG